MSIYLIIVAAVIILGYFMPQQGPDRKRYIILMAILHSLVSGLRYRYIHGDLRKYAANYFDMDLHGWSSEYVINQGKNTGFYLLSKMISGISGENFQIFLMILTVITEIILAVFIYKYSPRPWMSYLVWNCLGFYLLGFFALKQALAMALLMWAAIYIFENKPKNFVLLVLLAATIHMPAITFVPAYWIAKRKISYNTILMYIIIGILIFVFKNQMVNFMTSIYYEDDEYIYSGSIGGKFILILLFVLLGILIKGFKEKEFEAVFNLMIMAAIFQMFAGYGNIFTRWAEYYLQFAIIYIPMLFYKNVDTEKKDSMEAVMSFNKDTMKVIVGFAVVFLIWFYYTTNISKGNGTVNDITNFRFMWQVADGM